MEWSDEGIILATRRHGETSTIAEIFTRGHGRHMGLVRGGRSRRLQPILQPGNTVAVVWRARLDEHLGNWTVEPLAARAAALLEARHRLYAFQALAGHLRLFPERDPNPGIHQRIALFLERLSGEARQVAAHLARLELVLLADLGHGIDLSECAGTGTRENLVFVSPKSGRAVSAEAGRPYADRLLPLPAFLIGDADPSADDILAAARLTGHFLMRDLYAPRGLAMPPERDRLYSMLAGRLSESSR